MSEGFVFLAEGIGSFLNKKRDNVNPTFPDSLAGYTPFDWPIKQSNEFDLATTIIKFNAALRVHSINNPFLKNIAKDLVSSSEREWRPFPNIIVPSSVASAVSAAKRVLSI